MFLVLILTQTTLIIINKNTKHQTLTTPIQLHALFLIKMETKFPELVLVLKLLILMILIA
jgi:hypothetical protein